MDLTRQPPRRPSNAIVGGIVGLARMIDKARGHNEETIGEFRYGDGSGLDVEVLEFINMSADDFAAAVAKMDDVALGELALKNADKNREELDDFNTEHLERTPQDELHEQLLVERIAKYAPGRTDITTVFASIELDDWGAFRDFDLTAEPPRSPWLRSVFGLVGAARLADKARAVSCGKLGAYRYGDDSSQDAAILEFIGVDQDAFREAAYNNPNDDELTEWVAARCQKSSGEKSVFNAARCNVGRAGVMSERLAERRAEVAPDRGDIQTFFDLQDLDDQLSFGITDLRRCPPRSAYDDSVGGLVCLARIIDKFRAQACRCLGPYWCGKDSGFDRGVLKFLGLTPDEFAAGIEDKDDAAIVDWLGARLSGKSTEDIAALNERMINLGPDSERQWNFLHKAVAQLDPSRTDIETFAALTVLDDTVYFARLKAGV